MSTLFISHSSADNLKAKELKERLEEQGHRSVFLDLDPEAGIQAGTSWERTLYTKLRACRAVVALCSERYLASQWCFAEVALARMEGKDMFVLQIDPWSEQTKMPSILTEEQFIDLRTNEEEGYEKLWNGFKVKGIVPEEHREWGPDESPYPGLRAFEEKDAPIFFGRDDEIREGVELLNRVRRHGHPRMVMVLGSSGSGKSSLARAGIVPRLRRDVDAWRVVGPFRPGHQPTRELAAAFSRAFEEAGRSRAWEDIYRRLDASAADSIESRTEASNNRETGGVDVISARARLREALQAVAGELTAEDARLAETVRNLEDLLAHSPEESARSVHAPATGDNPLAELATELRLEGGSLQASVVLVIDQFEELLGHDDRGLDHPANRFLKLLRDGIETDDAPPLALGTMRSDFLGELQKCEFLQGLGFKSLSMGPMPKEGMRQVIERPALLGQLELEKGLPDLLLDQTGTSDALPLLAFTLRAMWDRYHEDRRLEIREYEELGGLQGAIALVADQTLEAALELGEERDLRDAFLRMARPAAQGVGWSRQSATWEEFPDTVRPMLQHFVDQRLLIKRADGIVEVAHEALFRSWGKLRGWLNANAEALHLLREIQVDAAKWDKAKSGEEKEPYLWRGGRLARALELRDSGVLALKDLDHAFIGNSYRAERARIDAEEARRQRELRRARVFAAVVGMFCVVAVGLFVYALVERNRAIDQEQEATARKLSFASRNQLGVDNQLALLLSLEGARIRPLPDLDALLREGLSIRGQVLRILDHAERVPFAAWDPSGERVVSTSYDQTAAVWDAASGQRIATCEAPGSGLDIAAWSPDGELLVAGGVWDPRGAYVWTFDDTGCTEFRRLAPYLIHAEWSPDGKRLVTTHREGEASIWNIDSGEVTPLEGHAANKNVGYASWNPTGTRIVTAGDDGTPRVFADDGTLLFPLEGHAGAVVSAAWNADGTRIVTASGDGTARVWDASDGGETVRLEGHSGSVTAAVWSPDGRRIVTTSADQTARVWDPVTGTQRAILVGHRGTVISAAWNLDGTRIVTAGDDGTAQVWDSSGERRAVLAGHAGPVKHAAWSPDSRFVVTASWDNTARVWDPEDTGPIPVLAQHTDKVVQVAWSSDDARVLTASDDGTARVWDAASGAEVALLDGHNLDGQPAAIAFAAWSPDDKQVVTASRDRTARIWDAATGEQLHLFRHEGPLNHVAWNPAGTQIATVSNDTTARVWDAASGTQISRLEHPANVVHSAWDSAGERLATSSWVGWGSARVWNTANGETPFGLDGVHGDAVWNTAWSPDDSRIITSGNDSRLGLFYAADDAEPRIFEHPSAVRHAAWNSQGTRIATACEDRIGRVWNAEIEAPPLELKGHGAEVRRVVWSPDDARILTASKDGTARVWDAESGEELIRLVGHTGPVRAVAWNSTGTLIVTASDDGTARLHYLELADLMDAACKRVIRNMTPTEWRHYMGEIPYRATCPDLASGTAAGPD